MTNKMYLVLGDWSDDGHGKSDKILVNVSHNVEQVRKAYEKSCKTLGFDIGEVCSDYEENTVSEKVMDILKTLNYPGYQSLMDEDSCLDIDTYVDLWFWVIGLCINDFKWSVAGDVIPCIN